MRTGLVMLALALVGTACATTETPVAVPLGMRYFGPTQVVAQGDHVWLERAIETHTREGVQRKSELYFCSAATGAAGCQAVTVPEDLQGSDVGLHSVSIAMPSQRAWTPTSTPSQPAASAPAATELPVYKPSADPKWKDALDRVSKLLGRNVDVVLKDGRVVTGKAVRILDTLLYIADSRGAETPIDLREARQVTPAN